MNATYTCSIAQSKRQYCHQYTGRYDKTLVALLYIPSAILGYAQLQNETLRCNHGRMPYPTRRALGRAHVPPTKVFRQLAVNKTISKPCLTASMGGQYIYVGFSRHNKIARCSAYTISEKAIRFRHPDYNLDLAQKLISSSMSRHLLTRNISSKSMHAFLSNLANRQTDKHEQKHFIYLLLCRR